MNGPLSSLAALMLLASCGTSPATPRAAAAATVGEPFTLAPAQTAQVEGTGLAVTFESVSADSRCPADVTCVWEGDAVILVTVRPAASTPSELHTSGRYASQVEAGDFRVRLVELKPVPRSGASPAPGEYRATLVVTRK